MTKTKTLAVLVALLGTVSPTIARADDGAGSERQPVPFVQRPLTLPHLTLSPELDGAWLRAFGANLGTLTLSAGFGITDNLQLTAVVVPLELADRFAEYGHASVGAAYRLVGHPGGLFELALGATVALPSQGLGSSIWGVALAVPMRLHLGGHVALDVAVTVPFTISTGGGSIVIPTGGSWDAAFAMPISLYVQIANPFFLGVGTGLTLPTLRGEVGASTAIPLSFTAGFTIPTARGPVADLLASFAFPDFATPGASDKLHTDLFTLTFAARFYFYFGS